MYQSGLCDKTEQSSVWNGTKTKCLLSHTLRLHSSPWAEIVAVSFTSCAEGWFKVSTFLSFGPGWILEDLFSTGGSAGILWSPWAVVWRKWPGWWQNVHLPRCGWNGDRVPGHLRRQSRQLPDPASWLCTRASVEWSDLQRSIFSGTHLIILVLLFKINRALLSVWAVCLILTSFRYTSKLREPPTEVYLSTEMNTRTLPWCWGGLTARGRHLNSTSLFWWWARATPCTGTDRHLERSSSL